MPEYIFSNHTKDTLKERVILEEWALQTINNPDQKNQAMMATPIMSSQFLNEKIGYCMWL